MKFYALIILPREIDIADPDAIESAAASQMKPFQMWQDDIPVGKRHWDYYWCCTKEWLTESQIDFTGYPTALADHPYLLFPAETLTMDGVVDAIVSPEREWLQSESTYETEDPCWPSKAIEICKRFAGHYVVLAYCHG